MSEMTPAQAAYEVIRAGDTWPGEWLEWDKLGEPGRHLWTAAVQAALAAFQVADDADMRNEMDRLRGELDGLREHIDSTALGMEMSARATAPSKKSEIESGCASALRGLLRIDGESSDETRERLDRDRRRSLDGLMPMGLHFDDADPVARCLVGNCQWHGHGDSVRDAASAWADHLARDHRGDWPED